jgi:hypothetical protein
MTCISARYLHRPQHFCNLEVTASSLSIKQSRAAAAAAAKVSHTCASEVVMVVWFRSLLWSYGAATLMLPRNLLPSSSGVWRSKKNIRRRKV